jgi:hypothetical protein
MKKALLIGIDYLNIPDATLKGCVNDIIIMRNMLIDAYNYKQQNITLLRDDVDNFIQPTKSNIINQLNLLVEDSHNLEEVILHYSGHGSQLQNQNYELKNIIVPTNYAEEGCIFDTEILEIIKKIKTNCRAIFIFDCCHSGSVCDMPWSFEYSNSNKDNYVRTLTSNSPIDNQNIYVLSACRDDQSSVDSSNNLDQSVGAFSNALVECLRASQHNIGILDLFKNISVFLIENGYSQTPIFSSSNMAPIFNINKNSCE